MRFRTGVLTDHLLELVSLLGIEQNRRAPFFAA